jgi:hypothetical protein
MKNFLLTLFCFICIAKSYGQFVSKSYNRIVVEIIKEKKLNKSYTKVDIKSAFLERDSSLAESIEKKLNESILPKKEVKKGKYIVSVKFIISKDGNISDIACENDPGFGICKDVINAIMKSQRWAPGEVRPYRSSLSTQINNSPKNSKSINEILTVNFLDSITQYKNNILYSYFSKGNSGLYELNYFDTVVAPIKNEHDLDLSLRGFMLGKFTGQQFKMYDLTIVDTSIGNLVGLFLSGIAYDRTQKYRTFYCYLTIANNKSYWFFVYQPTSGAMSQETKIFFNSIQFASTKIIEANYKIKPIREHKKIGKVWYISPELDFQIESNSKMRDSDSALPPIPPPPPA